MQHHDECGTLRARLSKLSHEGNERSARRKVDSTNSGAKIGIEISVMRVPTATECQRYASKSDIDNEASSVTAKMSTIRSASNSGAEFANGTS